MFLSLCHSSHSSADAYGLFRVLDNQQKKDKILPADIDVKQQWTQWTLQSGYPVIHVQSGQRQSCCSGMISKTVMLNVQQFS